MRGRAAALALLALLLTAACTVHQGSGRRFSRVNSGIGPGPGLLTGKSGAFNIPVPDPQR